LNWREVHEPEGIAESMLTLRATAIRVKLVERMLMKSLKLLIPAIFVGLVVAGLVSDAFGGPSSPSLDCSDTLQSAAITPGEADGRETAEEAMLMAKLWPDFEKVDSEDFESAKAFPSDGADANPRVAFELRVSGKSIAVIQVEQIDDLKKGQWFLMGYTACSPVGGDAT
jgi:hypothetical protein